MSYLNRVYRGSVGSMLLILGIIQGLCLGGIGPEAPIQGIIGGIFPVFAGFFGPYCISSALKK